MSELSNNLQTTSYNLYISSNDKVSGTNNNGTYQVNWNDFLPREYSTYTMSFSFQSGGGSYKDTAASFTASIAITGVMTLSAFTAGGYITVGQLVSGAGVPSGTYIISQLSGTSGGSSTATFQTNCYAVVVSATMSSNVVYSGAKIQMNSMGTSMSFDTGSKSTSNTLGFVQRDVQTSTSSSNSFSSFYLQFAPKTMSRPNQNLITISIANLNNNILLTDTNSLGGVLTDMTSWNMIMSFYPVVDSSTKGNYP